MRRSVTRGPPLTDRRRSYHSLRGRQLSLIGSARLSPPACSVTDRFGKVRGLFNVWFFNPERQLSSNRNVSGGSKRPIRRYARSRPKPAGHDCDETFQLGATASGRGERHATQRTEPRLEPGSCPQVSTCWDLARNCDHFATAMNPCSRPAVVSNALPETAPLFAMPSA